MKLEKNGPGGRISLVPTWIRQCLSSWTPGARVSGYERFDISVALLSTKGTDLLGLNSAHLVFFYADCNFLLNRLLSALSGCFPPDVHTSQALQSAYGFSHWFVGSFKGTQLLSHTGAVIGSSHTENSPPTKKCPEAVYAVSLGEYFFVTQTGRVKVLVVFKHSFVTWFNNILYPF